MQSRTLPVPELNSRIRPRTALVASADPSFRQRVSDTLAGLRWNVRAAEGGAHVWAETLSAIPEAVIVDHWLPDLDTATFNNGQKLNVGQVALGNVANLQGLEDLGNGNYATTLASGTATIGISGTAGLGTMVDGALEASNVNISAEFSNLIIAQRAFEANAKSVTTFDTVTQETINMIH
jgi:hypothetical protein